MAAIVRAANRFQWAIESNDTNDVAQDRAALAVLLRDVAEHARLFTGPEPQLVAALVACLER